MDEVMNVLRASPRIVLFASLLGYIVGDNTAALRFIVYFLITEGVSVGMKKVGGKILPNNLVTRPTGAGNCKGCDVFRSSSDGTCINIDDHIGMPSGHSMSIMMAAGFWCAWIFKQEKFDLNQKIVRMMVLMTLALAVVTSRTSVGENCHSIPQVTVGAIGGLGLGIGFFFLDQKLLSLNAPVFFLQ